jgi:hypothetical protein
MKIYSLNTSITLNIFGTFFILILDYLTYIDLLTSKHELIIGSILIGFGIISIISLLYDIQKNILLMKNNIDQLEFKQILFIFISNLLGFTMIYYGLYLINPDNFYSSLSKDKNKQYFHISTFINMFYLSFYNAITLGMNDIYPKSLLCKFVLGIELIISLVITIFFINRITDINIFNKNINNTKLLNKRN